MLEDELLLEGQVKRKKRFILLALFILLLITATATALLGPAAPTAPTVVVASLSPSPDQTGTPVADASGSTLTPELSQGDEFSGATASPGTEDRVTPEAAGATAIEAESGDSKTPAANASEAATQEATFTPKTTSETVIPATAEGTEASSDATADSTKESEPGLSTTLTPPAGTAVAALLPTTDAANQATPVAVATSRRIHESWDILDGLGPEVSSQAGTSEPVTSTTTLTTTSSSSETIALIPPNGLPVTGIIIRHGMNWAALVMVVVLLGAGAMALLSPRRR